MDKVEKSPQEAAVERLFREAEGLGAATEAYYVAGPAAGSPIDMHRAAVLQWANASSASYAHDLTALRESAPNAISVSEFLGPMYDFEARRLRRPSGDPQSGYWQTERSVGISGDILRGFAYAFAHPPYGTRPRDTVDEYLQAILRDALGLREDSIIFDWPTHWSSYFDAGREWWGTFLWSISNPGFDGVVVIAASATD